MCAREVPSSTLEYIHKQNKLQMMLLSSLTLVKNTVSKPFWIDTHISVHCLEIWPFLLCQMQHWDCFISPDALLISLWRLWAYSPTLVIYLRACQLCKWNRSFFPFKSLQLHCCHTLPGNVWRGKKNKQRTESRYHSLCTPFPSSTYTQRSDQIIQVLAAIPKL